MARDIPHLLEAFARLIETPSVSSIDPSLDMSNQPVVDLLAGWFEELGFSTKLLPLPNRPHKCNLIARLGEGEGGLVLAGHTDTVPYDEYGWNTDPFKLIERDGRLFGLGASDMKCFFPIVMEAVRGIATASLERPLYLLATADEESNMYGARALVESEVSLGSQALIGEPTGMQPIYMHKGVLLTTIRLTGRSGHSSDPSLGVNALEGMYEVIGALLAWRSELQIEHQNQDFNIPVPTLNLGHIQGGDNPNRICADCELGIDLRTLPDMSIRDLLVELQSRVRAAVSDFDLDIEFGDHFHGVDAMQTARDAEIVKKAEELTGKSAGSVAFGTEGPYLSALGMETVILGPGDIEVAHQANEYLPCDRIAPMIRLINSMIRHFCMEQPL